jgi:hypothetical protein
MTSDQLANAIIQGILTGGEGFLEGTMAAALPIIWLLLLALHLARPYMLGATAKFSLRLAADIWWVLYIGLRDMLMAVAFIMGFMFFFPDVVVARALPIGGSLSAVCLFAVLYVKLVSDADDDRRSFQLVSFLLAAGATLYIVPTLLGVQLSALKLGAPWDGLAAGLVTSNNQGLAVFFVWVSLIAVGGMGLAAVWYNVRRPQAELSRRTRATQQPATGADR